MYEEDLVELERQRRIAEELKMFFKSNAWAYMKMRLVEESDKCSRAFYEVSATDTGEIMKLQKRIGVIVVFENMLNEILALGETAERELEQH